MSFNFDVIEKAFPGDAGDISFFLQGQDLKDNLERCSRGERIHSSFSLGYRRFCNVTYRQRDGKPQVFVHSKIGEGQFTTVEKVAIVYGSMIAGAPGPIFARVRLNQGWKKDLSARQMMAQECLLTQQLTRDGVRHIVTYVRISCKTEVTSAAAELYDQDLFNYLYYQYPYGPVSLECTKKFLSQIAIPMATALSDLHGKGYVHLDFKPENIFLTKEKIAFLGDFGTCMRCIPSRLEQGEVSTNIVAAPETFNFHSEWRVDPSLDMWAFGMLLTNLFLGIKNNSIVNAFSYIHRRLSPSEKYELVVENAKKIVAAFSILQSKKSSCVDPRLCSLGIRLLNFQADARPQAAQVVHELCAIRDTL